MKIAHVRNVRLLYWRNLSSKTNIAVKSQCPEGCPCKNYECSSTTSQGYQSTVRTTAPTAEPSTASSTTIGTETTLTTSEESGISTTDLQTEPNISTQTSDQTVQNPTTPNTQLDHILVLSTYRHNQPLITNMDGFEAEIGFSFGQNAEVYQSCSMLWNGRMLVFGGRHEKTQISKIENCELQRIGNLTFEFWDGACAATGEKIVLCFVKADNNDECYTAASPLDDFRLEVVI